MQIYKAEEKADLEFSFPDDLNWDELDKQGVKLPTKMKFVDLVIEREHDILLIEIKDPSHSSCPEQERASYFKRLQDNSILSQELTPKARDSYTYLHLMERDTKPFKYIVLIGLDAFDAIKQKALLLDFKDRLLADIRCESFEPWKRHHIADCVVFSVEGWNSYFPKWQISRISAHPTTATSLGATP